jgi:hypothetical protein
LTELQFYDVNFGTTKYEHSALRKYFLKTAISDHPRFSGAQFRKPFSNGRFSKNLEMSIELLGVGTDPLPGRFQLFRPLTSQYGPQRSIGTVSKQAGSVFRWWV